MLGTLRFWFTKDLVWRGIQRKSRNHQADWRTEIRQGQALQAIQLDIGRIFPGELTFSPHHPGANLIRPNVLLVQLGSRRHFAGHQVQQERHPGQQRSERHQHRVFWQDGQDLLPHRANVAPPTCISLLGRLPGKGNLSTWIRPDKRKIHGNEYQGDTRRAQSRNLYHLAQARQ